MDFLDIFWELTVKGYEYLLRHSEYFRNLVDSRYFVYLNLLDKHKQEIAAYILQHVSFKFFTYARIVLEIFRKMVFLRFLVTWFPFFNPYGTIVEFLVAPVDAIIRPITWHLPKFALVDLSSWFIFFIIEGLMEICSYIESYADYLNL